MFDLGLAEHGPSIPKILVDLAEEDFTSRTFDNVRSLHGLSKVILKEFQGKSEEDFVVAHLDTFFKYRNRVAELEKLAAQHED